MIANKIFDHVYFILTEEKILFTIKVYSLAVLNTYLRFVLLKHRVNVKWVNPCASCWIAFVELDECKILAPNLHYFFVTVAIPSELMAFVSVFLFNFSILNKLILNVNFQVIDDPLYALLLFITLHATAGSIPSETLTRY